MTGNSNNPLERYLSTHPNAREIKEPTRGEQKALREAEKQADQSEFKKKEEINEK